MKPALSLKTLYRSPVRTILTFILLSIVTFAFFSQAAEISITSREFDTSAKRYYGIGTVTDASEERSPYTSLQFFTDPRTDEMPPTGLKTIAQDSDISRYSPTTDEQVKSLFSLPYIAYGDARYMTAGVSDVYYRPDDGNGFYNYTAHCVIEATLSELILANDNNRLFLDGCKLLAGNPVINDEEKQIIVLANPNKYNESDIVGMGAYSYRPSSVFSNDYIWDTDYVQSMMPGERYVFVLRFCFRFLVTVTCIIRLVHYFVTTPALSRFAVLGANTKFR